MLVVKVRMEMSASVFGICCVHQMTQDSTACGCEDQQNKGITDDNVPSRSQTEIEGDDRNIARTCIFLSAQSNTMFAFDSFSCDKQLPVPLSAFVIGHQCIALKQLSWDSHVTADISLAVDST